MVDKASTSTVSHLSDLNDRILQGLMAAVLSSAVTKTTTAPIDRVKLLLQLQHKSITSAVEICYKPYNGIFDCFRRVCAEQGWKSLWRGNSAQILRIVPTNVLNIAFRDYFRMMFLQNVNRKQQPCLFFFGNVAAGGASSCVTLLFVYPLDFARTRLALETENRMAECFKTIYKNEGFRGFYSGFISSLHFTMASRAVFFGIFDSIRLSFADEQGKQLSFFFAWLLAQASIIISSMICYPLDTIRRAMMMQAGEANKLYKNSLQCFNEILRNEGVSAFYRGSLSNSLKCTSGALIIALYYEALKYL